VKTALLTLAYTFASAVVPLLNAELYLAALATQIRHTDALWLACAAGAGQTVGKLLWYAAFARSADLPWLRRRIERSPRALASFDSWRARTRGRPVWTAGAMLASATVGIPPLLVMGAVGGALRMPLWTFAGTIFVGRTLQSWTILAGLAVIVHGV